MQRHSDPRLRRFARAAFTAAAFALPAFAQQADFGPRPPAVISTTTEATYVAPAVPQRIEPSSAIHAGAGNAADQDLAERVADAIADEPLLDGATVTVAANDGEVSLTGSAASPEQAAIAEQVAREVAGPGAVSGTLSEMGG